MTKICTTTCCGMRLIYGFNNKTDNKSIIQYVSRKMQEGYNGAFIVYTNDTISHRKGDGLKEFIEENKLGKVQKLVAVDDKGNEVITWAWELSRRNIIKF